MSNLLLFKLYKQEISQRETQSQASKSVQYEKCHLIQNPNCIGISAGIVEKNCVIS